MVIKYENKLSNTSSLFCLMEIIFTFVPVAWMVLKTEHRVLYSGVNLLGILRDERAD